MKRGTPAEMAAEIETLKAKCWQMKEERDRALEWRDHDKEQVTRLTARVKELEGALGDAGRVLDWAARKMKGNCAGSDVNTVMLAAGRTADARAALSPAQPAPSAWDQKEEQQKMWDIAAEVSRDGE